MQRVLTGPGPPTRSLLARCIAQIFTIAESYDLNETLNACNDALRARDDSHSQVRKQRNAVAFCSSKKQEENVVAGRQFSPLVSAASATRRARRSRRNVRQSRPPCRPLVRGVVRADDALVEERRCEPCAACNLRAIFWCLQSASRVEILRTLARMVGGLGESTRALHKDIYKQIAKIYIADRVMAVRVAAARVRTSANERAAPSIAGLQCLSALLADRQSPLYASADIDALLTIALRALDGSNFEVRQEVAKIFGKIAAYAHHTPSTKTPTAPTVAGKIERPTRAVDDGAHFSFAGGAQQPTSSVRLPTLDDVLSNMRGGFLRGGIGGFLKGGAGAAVGGHREIRVGVALVRSKRRRWRRRARIRRLDRRLQAYVEVARELGMRWLERNLLSWQKHLLDVARRAGALSFTKFAAFRSQSARQIAVLQQAGASG